MQQPESCAPPHITQPAKKKRVKVVQDAIKLVTYLVFQLKLQFAWIATCSVPTMHPMMKVPARFFWLGCPSAVLDSVKYFFKNLSTTSSQVLRLLPLNKWSHLFASPDMENENKLNLTASSGTPASLTVLQISI